MTPQEIFDKTAKHLFEQGRPAKAFGGMCKYQLRLGDKVLRCAVGCHIPDAAYSPAMENRSIADLMAGFSSQLPAWFADNVDLLRSLQHRHDADSGWKSTAGMQEYLADVATNYNLNTDVLETLKFGDR
jgi:hypothetical protein